MHRILLTSVSLVALGGALTMASTDALAQAAPATPAPAEQSGQTAPAAPASFWDTYKISGYLDAGITFNPANPSDGLNFGQLYTDRANTPLLNQLSAIATRPTDPKATGFDYGFTFQPMYGTDARFTHYFNQFDRVINSRYQFDIVEGDLLFHVPTTDGGTDIKVGEYPTPIGYEVINPTGNPLYSHSYIYNFGIPIKHAGVLTTTHVNPLLDVYLSFDFGNLATPIVSMGDNNEALAFLGGFGFNLLDGNLTIVALTHDGPENACRFFAANDIGGGCNSVFRYFNDIVTTYKVNDTLTLTNELNYVKDDIVQPGVFDHPDAYGVAQYATYTLNDLLTLQGRAEIWRDNQGFFAAAFPANFDFTNAARGLPNTSITVAHATYYEATFGVNIKPPLPDNLSHFNGTLIRPELRFDHAADAHPFDDGTKSNQVTIAADLLIPF